MPPDTHTLAVRRVWIAPGCIVCNLCEDTCPEVFDVRDDTCYVREAAQQYYGTHARQIARAAEECPVEVIRVTGLNEPNVIGNPNDE